MADEIPVKTITTDDVERAKRLNLQLTMVQDMRHMTPLCHSALHTTLAAEHRAIIDMMNLTTLLLGNYCLLFEEQQQNPDNAKWQDPLNISTFTLGRKDEDPVTVSKEIHLEREQKTLQLYELAERHKIPNKGMGDVDAASEIVMGLGNELSKLMAAAFLQLRTLRSCPPTF
jgi:hypothetical protein